MIIRIDNITMEATPIRFEALRIEYKTIALAYSTLAKAYGNNDLFNDLVLCYINKSETIALELERWYEEHD